MSGCVIVIPARLGSKRFPGKVLARLGGKSVVEWCWRAAKAANVGPVFVATEHRLVAQAVAAFGATPVLTPDSCVSGSDRVHAAVKGFRQGLIVNLQGDQPLIRPSTIRRVVALLRQEPAADIATAVMPVCDRSRIADDNVVKAAFAADGRALYFSRSPIPYRRNPGAVYEHLGIYVWRRKALKRFVGLPPSPLEKSESLEQLRALEDGMAIYAAVVSDRPVAIDTPADLRRAERILKSMRGKP